MPRLSKAQDAARRRVVHLAARLLAVVEGAIGWDGCRLFGVDPGSLLVNRLLAASAEDGWARLEWLWERAGAAAGGGVAAGEAPGILVLKADGRLRFATPAGERWHDRLADADRAGHAPLPTAIHAAVAGLRAAGEGMPALSLLASTAAGDVRVEASPAGADGSVAIVLAPGLTPAAPAAPAGWPLTPQERQVVDLLIGGASNRGIAATLRIAEHTVEWHLPHAYAKLEVRGRTQLLARVFREAHLPGLAERETLARG